MSRLSLSAIALVALFASAQVALAEPKSGPEVGSKVSPLKVYVAIGDKAKEEVDLSAERKDKPTVYCFVRADKFDRPVYRFLKTLDTKLADEAAEIGIVNVWCTEDADASKEYLNRAKGSLELTRGCYAIHPALAGPEGWGVNPDVHVTVVVAKGGKVEAVWALISTNETDVPAVIEALEKK